MLKTLFSPFLFMPPASSRSTNASMAAMMVTTHDINYVMDFLKDEQQHRPTDGSNQTKANVRWSVKKNRRKTREQKKNRWKVTCNGIRCFGIYFHSILLRSTDFKLRYIGGCVFIISCNAEFQKLWMKRKKRKTTKRKWKKSNEMPVQKSKANFSLKVKTNFLFSSRFRYFTKQKKNEFLHQSNCEWLKCLKC